MRIPTSEDAHDRGDPDMRTLALAISTLMLLAATPAVTQQFYRYVDANGHVRFTDDINQVPEKQRTVARSYVESRGVPAEVKQAEAAGDTKAPGAAAPTEAAASATGAAEDPPD